jgi:hypothetical protein
MGKSDMYIIIRGAVFNANLFAAFDHLIATMFGLNYLENRSTSNTGTIRSSHLQVSSLEQTRDVGHFTPSLAKVYRSHLCLRMYMAGGLIRTIRTSLLM